MMQELPSIVFGAVSGLAFTGGVLVFLASAVYEIRMARKQTSVQSRYHKPLVTVLIPVMDESESRHVPDALRSLSKGTYRKYEAIVIYNHLSKQSFKAKSVRSAATRKKVPYDQLIENGFRQSKGEVIVVLPPTTRAHVDSLKNMVVNFMVDSGLTAQVGRTRRAVSPKLSSDVAMYADSWRDRVAMARDILSLGVAPQGLLAYRRAEFMKRKQQKYRYKSNLITHMQLKQRVRRSLLKLLGKWVFWAAAAAYLGYAWYIALALDVVQPLGFLWVGLCGFLLLHLVSSSHLTGMEKLRLLTVLPAWFMLANIYIITRLLAPLTVLTRVRVRISLAA